MKTSSSQIRVPGEIGCLQQIVAHVGGMARAWLRHRPIHFTFHWRGICRALLAAVPPSFATWRSEAGRKRQPPRHEQLEFIR